MIGTRLARDAARVARTGEPPAGVPGAIRLLEGAVWELAAAHDDPPRFLRDGDEFEVEIKRIGSLRNTFRAESL